MLTKEILGLAHHLLGAGENRSRECRGDPSSAGQEALGLYLLPKGRSLIITRTAKRH